MENNYLPIVGLEIHVELKTLSKMFCSCKNDPFHAGKPNIYTCPVCLGLPGALPVPNKKAVEWTVMLGLALGCEIPLFSKFDRKNYFYPDLPKGYQISQYDQPLCKNGKLVIATDSAQSSNNGITTSFSASRRITPRNNNIRIRINRVHLEEDTAKLMHQQTMTLIDFNRSGVPLVEIVTEPDIHSTEDAKLFLKKLHQIIRYLGISDADMEKGSMRLEPNISVQRLASSVQLVSKLPPYKVEVKNINSFRFVGMAIEYEVKRQIEFLEKGETPKQETRGWDEKKGVTLPQRSKEEAHDYRYFPEPDIPPMHWQQSTINNLQLSMQEMPDVKLNRFIKDYGLPRQTAERLTETREIADYYENCVKCHVSSVTNKDITNWLLNRKVDLTKVSPEELLKQIQTTKTVVVLDEGELNKIVKSVIEQNPKVVSDYKSGKTNAIMFLVGHVMREIKGRGDAKIISQKLKVLLT